MDERSLRSCRILIVDDQVSSICLLVNILGRMGYHHIRSLTEPAKIFDELAAHPADLIVLDLCMPLFDGVQVMEQLKNAGAPLSDIPILVVTGDASPFNKRRALAAGATDLLQKPFDSSELMMRIRNLLQARLLRQELNNYALMLERMVDERTRELDAALTELRATQLQVVQQERLRAFSEMASGIVHDFNNALMSVTGYTELLLTGRRASFFRLSTPRGVTRRESWKGLGNSTGRAGSRTCSTRSMQTSWLKRSLR
jgi:PleD family two-component response regulator